MSYQDLPATGSRFWGDAVSTLSALPASGTAPGECRVTLDTDIIYEWNGTSWQLITNGAAGNALAATVAGLTEGSVTFVSSGTLAEDNTQLFWDADNNRLGVGTNNPQNLLHVKGSNVVPAGSPTSGSGSINYGQPSGYITAGYNWNYYVYAYVNYGGLGTLYFSVDPAISGSLTDDGRTTTAPTPGSFSAVIDYNGDPFGYNAVGHVIDYYLYVRVSTPQGDVWSASPAYTQVVDNNGGINYDVNLSWSLDASALEYILFRVIDGGTLESVSSLGTASSYVDNASGWSSNSTPTPTMVQDTYSITVSWTPPAVTPDGYRILRYSTNTGDNFDYYLDVSGGSASYTDSNTDSWTYGPVLTPTALFGDALKVEGNVGFYGATPVAQYSTPGASGFSVGGGANVYEESTWTGGIGSSAYTVGDIVRCLKLLGFFA